MRALIVDNGFFEHEIGLDFTLFPNEPSIEVLLITEDDFIVALICLESAPHNFSG
jgi:hypothetical protein